MKSVYLAGPITGFTFDGCVDWRNYARDELEKAGIEGLSPMRGKDYLKAMGGLISADGDKYSIMGPLSTNRGIMTRDRFDATRCDVLLVNFLGAAKASIGTCMEIAWADLKRIPIVCVMVDGDPHEHGMILEAIGFRVDTLDKGLELVKAILNAKPPAYSHARAA